MDELVALHIIIVGGVLDVVTYLGFIVHLTLYIDPYANVITPSVVAFADILFLDEFIFKLPILKIWDTTFEILFFVAGAPVALAYTPE